jgi:hypothetical protein
MNIMPHVSNICHFLVEPNMRDNLPVDFFRHVRTEKWNSLFVLFKEAKMGLLVREAM